MINTIVNLKITKLRELSTLSVDREYLTVDYLDENGEEQRIEKLTHEEDLGEYNVKTDLWADILEDWRLTKPIPVPSAEKEDWKLLEDYLWNLSDSRYQELLDNRNKLYEADDVANILRNISRFGTWLFTFGRWQPQSCSASTRSALGCSRLVARSASCRSAPS